MPKGKKCRGLHTRALILLDNVDRVEQLNMFTGNRETITWVPRWRE